MTDFGPHLMLDFHTKSDKLSDIDYWKYLLIRLVKEVGMTPLIDPVVAYSECENPAWDPPQATGVSGFIVLSESHISFHTFVESQYVFLDIFSCKEFDYSIVLKVLNKELGAHACNVSLVHRGKNFPFSEERE